MLNIVICDDNTGMLDMFAAELEECAELCSQEVEIVTFENGHDALEHCQTNKFDIIYMDIELGDENGMDFAKKMKEINPNALIVYISAYDYYYTTMVQAEPFRFILKDADLPKMKRDILSTFEAALERINGRIYFTYIFDGVQFQVDPDSIEYFYSDRRKIHIVGKIGEFQNYFYGKMDDLELELEKISDKFMRINKSCIVNSKHTSLIYHKKNRVAVADTFLYVAPKYWKEVSEKINSVRIN